MPSLISLAPIVSEIRGVYTDKVPSRFVSFLVCLMLIKNVQYNTHSATCCIHNTLVLCIKTYLSDTFVRLQAQFVDCFWILAKSAHWRLSRSAPAPHTVPVPQSLFQAPFPDPVTIVANLGAQIPGLTGYRRLQRRRRRGRRRSRRMPISPAWKM